MTDRDDIPSRRAIDAYVAGVNGSSAYHRARHEVWSAIRDRYDDGPSQQGSGLEREEFRRLALEAARAPA